MSATRAYRLETAIRRLYDLRLGPSEYERLSVKLKFLDFPDILIRPETTGQVFDGGAVPFNVCHRAEFQMTDDQRIAAFPARCFCEMVKEGARSDANSAQSKQDIRWTCPCPLQQSDSESRAYNSFPIIDHQTGDTVGYAEMACRVVPDAPFATTATPPPPPPPLPLPVPYYSTPNAAVTGRDQLSSSPAVPGPQGRPYIVRVVVNGNNNNNKDRRSSGGGSGGDSGAAYYASGRSPGQSRKHATQPGSSVPVMRPTVPADEETLLYVLEYDVACQLQSFAECLATTLKREHSLLNGVANGKRAAARVAYIDADVKNVFKVSNIVLQIANQLVDGSDVPERTGMTRLGKETPLTKRNPINKLPAPKKGSIYEYLLYDVLFQLQCLGTNLSYLVAVYPTALAMPLKKLPDQHVAFCRELEAAVQSLVRNVNVLTQSALDGRYHKDGAPVAGAADAATATTTTARKHKEIKKASETRRSKSSKKDKNATTRSSARRASPTDSSPATSRSSSASSSDSSVSSGDASSSSSSRSGSSSVDSSSLSSSVSTPIVARAIAPMTSTTASLSIPPPPPVPVNGLAATTASLPLPGAGTPLAVSSTLPLTPPLPPPLPSTLSAGAPAAPVLSAGAAPTAGSLGLLPPPQAFPSGSSGGTPSAYGDQLEAFRFGGGGSSPSLSVGDSRSNSLGGPTMGVAHPLSFNASGSLGAPPLLGGGISTTSTSVPALSISIPQAPSSFAPPPPPTLVVPPSSSPVGLPIPIPPPLAR